jgi:hypothetical protein
VHKQSHMAVSCTAARGRSRTARRLLQAAASAAPADNAAGFLLAAADTGGTAWTLPMLGKS